MCWGWSHNNFGTKHIQHPRTSPARNRIYTGEERDRETSLIVSIYISKYILVLYWICIWLKLFARLIYVIILLGINHFVSVEYKFPIWYYWSKCTGQHSLEVLFSQIGTNYTVVWCIIIYIVYCIIPILWFITYLHTNYK